MFKGDQMDLVFVDWADPKSLKRMGEARKERRAELDKILASKPSLTPDDQYYCALLIVHTAKGKADSDRAAALAEEAVARGCKLPHAKWMIARNRDERLWNEKKPQWYGTQVRRDRQNGNKWTLDPFDPTAVTDAERSALCVPNFAARQKEISVWNGGLP